jgi:phosphoribosylglycinamide formyltransferase-1
MSFKIVILGSGRGSNAEALLLAEARGELGAGQIVALFSDQPQAGILDVGRAYNKTVAYIDPGRKGARFAATGEDAYIKTIGGLQPDLVVLAGFMRIISQRFIAAFHGRVINLHPSLLPSFPGLDALAQAIDAGVRVAGCSVHWVTPELDAGPIIEQAAFRIDPAADPELARQALTKAEHTLLPQVVAAIANGKIKPITHK